MSHPTKPAGLKGGFKWQRWFGEEVGTGVLLLCLVAALLLSRHVPFLPGFSPAASGAAILVKIHGVAGQTTGDAG